MDRKGLKDDSSMGGWSVAMLIDKFAEQDQLNKTTQEVKEAKKMYEKAIREKQELETEIGLQGGKFYYNNINQFSFNNYHII
jgi:cytokinesis protein